MRTIRSKLTYANVMVTIPAFVALGGEAAFAAGKLAKNSVGTKQIKNQAVTSAKIKKGTIKGTQVANGSLTGTQINASTLSTVPTARTANTAQSANSIVTPEAWHEVGTSEQPSFLNSWANVAGPIHPETAAFYKDHEGVVHLRGAVTGGGSLSVIFQLPAGDRPANGQFIRVPVGCTGGTGCPNDVASVIIAGSNFAIPVYEGGVIAPSEATDVYLNGITSKSGVVASL